MADTPDSSDIASGVNSEISVNATGIVNVKVPLSLDDRHGDIAANWDQLKIDWKIYQLSGGSKGKNKKEIKWTLMSIVGSQAQRFLIDLDPQDTFDADDVIMQLDGYFLPRTNVILQRLEFNRMQQEPGESFDSFFKRLQEMIRKCKYNEVKSYEKELFRDRIVQGISSTETRKKLIGITGLSLDQAVDICKTDEACENESKRFLNPSCSDVNVDQIECKMPSREPSKSWNNNCTFCGRQHARGKCPAYGKNCNKCGRKGHFAVCCRNKKKRIEMIHEESDEENYNIRVAASSKINNLSAHMILNLGPFEDDDDDDEEEWIEKVTIGNKIVDFKLDSGAQANCMSEKTFKKIGTWEKIVQPRNKARLVSYSNHVIEPLGIVTLKCEVQYRIFSLTFYVISQDVPDLIGLKDMKKMKLVQRIKYEKPQRIMPVGPESTEKEIVGENSNIFTGVGCLKEKHRIRIRSDVQPKRSRPKRIPETMRPKVKQQISTMEETDIIEPVKEPPEWISPMSVTTKENGDLRICIDSRELNKAIIPFKHKMQTVEEICAKMPGAKYFAKLDLKSGFHQIPLDEESSQLCTFHTPFGLYRYKRLPFGIIDASEVFQRRMEQHFGEFGECLVDDILIHGKTRQEHDEKLGNALQRAKEIGVTFNPDKLVVGATSIKYAGMIISAEGCKPDPEKVKAVQEMPCPKNKEELRSFLGMCSYLSRFIPNLSKKTDSLRMLTKSNIRFAWKKKHENAFKEIKKVIVSEVILQLYDVTKPITLQVDASSKGLGACLMQDRKPIAFASMALSPSQTKYSQIEKECLAIKFGCKRFHHFVYGKEILVETDHKPLESIFAKSLDKSPPRIARMLMDLIKYQIQVKWIRGKDMLVADALSRIYLDEIDESLDTKAVDVEVYGLEAVISMSEKDTEKFKNAIGNSAQESKLLKMITFGWPKYVKDVPKELHAFWNFREELTQEDGIIFKGQRVFVPIGLRKEVLEELHEAHFGRDKTLQRARQLYFWPKMKEDIVDKVGKCEICQQNKGMNEKEPLIPHAIPDRQWQKIGVDFFSVNNRDFLVAVDYSTSFLELMQMRSKTATALQTKLKELFTRHGIPEIVFSDNGPPFESREYKEFASKWKFAIQTSSPKYPMSNGKAESGVKIAKKIVIKNEDWHVGLMEYNATPIPDIGLSPAQMMYGRNIRTKLPSTSEALTNVPNVDVKGKLKIRKTKQKELFDRNVRREMKPLKVGDDVWIKPDEKKKWKKGKVTKCLKFRSYEVEDQEGRVYRRNRKFITRNKE